MYHVGMFVEYDTEPRRMFDAVSELISDDGMYYGDAEDLIIGWDVERFKGDDLRKIAGLALRVVACINNHGGVARFVEDGSALG